MAAMTARALVAVLALLCLAHTAVASSHSEAPGQAKTPNADLTDFYAFQSYEPGRSGFTTFVMNIYPLQNPFGGPNYFSFSDQHFFEINVDNNGDCVEDMIFQFYYGAKLGGAPITVTNPDLDGDCPPTPYQQQVGAGIALTIGTGANSKNVTVPLKFVGPISKGNTANLNWFESYNLNFIQGSRTQNTGAQPVSVLNSNPAQTTFTKPFDYAGQKTFGNAAAYEAYAESYLYNISIPGCSTPGRVFVGQRKDSFRIALGQTFDLINFNPITAAQCDSNDDLNGLNIGSFVLEVPTSCLLAHPGSDTFGSWATVRKLQHTGASGHTPGMQVGRLGNPLINELFIGLIDKNNFNMGVPTNDSYFIDYVTNPTLPAIIDLLFRAAVNSSTNIAPSNIPRLDLVQAFLFGIPGINMINPAATACEYLRLNTTILPTAFGNQSSMGVIGGDSAGFPNGRRPGDDVVDIALTVAMGRLCHIGINCTAADAPVGAVALTDGAPLSDQYFYKVFPYLVTPNPGGITNPNGAVCPNSPSPTSSPSPASTTGSSPTPCPVCPSGAASLVASVLFALLVAFFVLA